MDSPADMLFYWFFAELDTCGDLRELEFLYGKFNKYWNWMEEGRLLPNIVTQYKPFMEQYHTKNPPELLFKTGMI